MTEGDAFRLLGIGPGATQAEVRAAFRRRVMEHHPDTAAEGSVGPDVQALVDAYRLLIGSAPTPGYETPRRFGERSDLGRRIEVKHRPGPDTGEATRWTSRCGGCGGTGVRLRTSTCPHCRGAGQVTVLGVDRAGVTRCRDCRGQGRVRSLEACDICGGSGT